MQDVLASIPHRVRRFEVDGVDRRNDRRAETAALRHWVRGRRRFGRRSVFEERAAQAMIAGAGLPQAALGDVGAVHHDTFLNADAIS
ncbi:hypothetical protein CQ12_20985 [Bradyrhizobium jicamae]|uniref:Uncharacterized protein n=1 Tax=Bradyrhizobium jicamae TaxID=280332 RepID=A0A0R3KER8_9BRAD|nr:hypothetical protein CQ12_20985 [Bradyrhizobium jicamae]